jgi:hypothetical protein
MPEQFAEQVHLFTQARIYFRHVALLLLTMVNRVPSAPSSYKGATHLEVAWRAGSRLVERRSGFASRHRLRPVRSNDMRIRELARHWEQNAKGQLTPTRYHIHLDVESAARLAALTEMYHKHHSEELLGELIGAALEELEASLPYVKGNRVVALDEQGDPLYEDVGPTPRFLALSRKYLRQFSESAEGTNH